MCTSSIHRLLVSMSVAVGLTLLMVLQVETKSTSFALIVGTLAVPAITILIEKITRTSTLAGELISLATPFGVVISVISIGVFVETAYPTNNLIWIFVVSIPIISHLVYCMRKKVWHNVYAG